MVKLLKMDVISYLIVQPLEAPSIPRMVVGYLVIGGVVGQPTAAVGPKGQPKISMRLGGNDGQTNLQRGVKGLTSVPPALDEWKSVLFCNG